MFDLIAKVVSTSLRDSKSKSLRDSKSKSKSKSKSTSAIDLRGYRIELSGAAPPQALFS